MSASIPEAPLSVVPNLPVPVVAGPTASGKTEVGIRLAELLGGEVVSADARQVYRGMDVGTAKPTPAERARAVHHLLDVVDPDEAYSAACYARDAASAIEEIAARGRRPIVVGGSGMYLEALFVGLSPIPRVPGGVREAVRVEAEGDLAALYAHLSEVDPETARTTQPQDVQRITRAVEVHRATGRPISHYRRMPRKPSVNCPARWFGIRHPRDVLYGRIDARVDEMLRSGLVDEVRLLQVKGYAPELNALDTFGYREVFDHLAGRLGLAEAADLIRQGTRRYAKRQMTWFGNRRPLEWIAPGPDAHEAIACSLEG